MFDHKPQLGTLRCDVWTWTCMDRFCMGHFGTVNVEYYCCVK